jgi:CRP/FNR family transcriptional regulator, cyclic AMP receptor protein
MTEPNILPDDSLPDPADLARDPTFIEHAARTLGDSDLTYGLVPHQIARLATIAEMRAYHPGTLVCDEHERSDELYIIDSGSLEIWLDPASIGRPGQPHRRIAELQAGQTCGELALLDQGVRSAQVRAGSHGARLVAFKRHQLIGLCDEDTMIGYRLMRNLAGVLALRLRIQDMRLYDE